MGAQVAAWVVTTIGVTGKAAAVVSAVVTTAVNVGISYGASALLAPNQDFPNQGREFVTRGTTDPQTIVFGRSLVRGTAIAEYAFNPAGSGKKNNSFMRVQALAGHELDAIESFKVNGETCEVSGSGRALTAPYNKSANWPGVALAAPILTIYSGLGASDQIADANLIDHTDGFWRTSDRLQGLAWLAFVMRTDKKAFASGLPDVSAIVRGLKVHDPRDEDSDPVDPSTWNWTDNPILLAAHFDRFELGPRGEMVGDLPGRVAPESATDWSQVEDEADACDEMIDRGDGELEKRYRCWGQATTAEDPETVLQKIMGSCSGWHVRQGGVFRPWAGRYHAPTTVITPPDFTGPVSVRHRRSVAEQAGGVRGKFVSPDDNYRAVSYPDVVEENVAGTPRFMELPLPMTPSPWQAQRQAFIELKRRRAGKRLSGPLNLKGLLTGAGDTASISFPSERLVEETMLIRDWTMQQGEDGKPEFDIVAETHSPAHYTYPELSPPIAPEPPLGGGGSAARVPPGAPQILNPRPTYEDYVVIP